MVCQRVSAASVSVADRVVAEIGRGLLLLVGVAAGDGAGEVDAAVKKISGLRVFADAEDKMNLAMTDVAGEVLVVSQFTLLGDATRGMRPSFTKAASPEVAGPLIDRMAEEFRARGITTAQGVFGAKMAVASVNDGPVTIVLDFAGGRTG